VHPGLFAYIYVSPCFAACGTHAGLAFACHTVCDHAGELWRLAGSKASSRAQFFNRLVAITSFLVFPSWDDLARTLAFLQPPTQPP
jgi:hypothetical protein